MTLVTRNFVNTAILLLALVGSLSIGWAIGNQATLFVLMGLAAIGGLYAIHLPYLVLLLFVFIIPLEDFFILGSALTYNRILGIALFAAFMSNLDITKIRQTVYIPPVLIWLALWLGLGILSLVWSVAPSLSVTRINSEVQLVAMVILIVNLVNSVGQLRLMLQVYLVACVLLALLGLTALTLQANFVDAGRAIAVEGQSETTFAALVASGAVIALVFGFYTPAPQRYVYIGALLVLVLAIIASAGRGSMVSLIVVMGVLLVFARETVFRRTTWLVTGALIALVAVYTLSESDVLSDAIWNRLNPQTAIETGASNRTRIWESHLRYTIPEAPLLGYGLGTAYYVHGTNAQAAAFTGIGFRDSHSDIIQLLVDLGSVGLLIWLLFHVQLWRILSRREPLVRQQQLTSYYWLAKLLLIQAFISGLSATYLWEKRVFLGFAIAICVIKLVDRLPANPLKET